MPGALACLRLELQCLCDFFSPSVSLMDLSDWVFFVYWLVKKRASLRGLLQIFGHDVRQVDQFEYRG